MCLCTGGGRGQVGNITCIMAYRVLTLADTDTDTNTDKMGLQSICICVSVGVGDCVCVGQYEHLYTIL